MYHIPRLDGGESVLEGGTAMLKVGKAVLKGEDTVPE